MRGALHGECEEVLAALGTLATSGVGSNPGKYHLWTAGADIKRSGKKCGESKASSLEWIRRAAANKRLLLCAIESSGHNLSPIVSQKMNALALPT